jgi:uncharacterized protein DUF433
MEWQDCSEIETVPGKVGGRPVIKGTRVELDVILVDEEYGRTPEQMRGTICGSSSLTTIPSLLLNSAGPI